MFTLFTTPKPFNLHFGVIQINAIRSWTYLHPASEVIIFGDEDGAAEAARLLNIRHVTSIRCNEYGTPLISDLFEQAKQLAKNPILVYVNADIILMSDFRKAVEFITSWRRHCLIIGRRYNVDIREPLDFKDDWEEQLTALAQESISLSMGIDIFVFPKDLFDEVPPFAVGRAYWDNWPLYAARQRKAAVVDITQTVTIIHQNHNYSHLVDAKVSAYSGPEAMRNKELLGGMHKLFTSLEATHLLTPVGVKVRCRSCYPACVCNPNLPS
jgi:hypothetical protein